MNISPVSNFNLVNNYQANKCVSDNKKDVSFTAGLPAYMRGHFADLHYCSPVKSCARDVFKHYGESGNKVRIIINADDGGYDAYKVLVSLWDEYKERAKYLCNVIGVSKNKNALRDARSGLFYLEGKIYRGWREGFEHWFRPREGYGWTYFEKLLPEYDKGFVSPKLRGRLHARFKNMDITDGSKKSLKLISQPNTAIFSSSFSDAIAKSPEQPDKIAQLLADNMDSTSCVVIDNGKRCEGLVSALQKAGFSEVKGLFFPPKKM